MKGLKSREFLVTNLNQWDPHPLNITKNHISKVQSNYDVLATTKKRGPQIVEHFNTIAFQFQISKNFPETTQLLKNFIEYQIKRVYHEGKVGSILTHQTLTQNSPTNKWSKHSNYNRNHELRSGPKRFNQIKMVSTNSEESQSS